MNIEQLKQYEPLFGSWVVDSKVAAGKNSVVYKVVRNQNGYETAAVKVVSFPLESMPIEPKRGRGRGKDRESMFEELVKSNMNKMLTLRVNKNVVRFDNYMTIKDNGTLHIIILTELLTPLNNFLTQEKFNCRQIAKIGSDICCAIDGFRKIGVVHKEIKPENIFVDDEGNFKLGDFGIVDCEIPNGGNETSSAYLAPEVLNSSGADYCSDVYSLGLLMYKFLNNNRMPFMPEFPEAINDMDKKTAFERRMAGEQLVKPANADIPMTRIILRACAFKAEERYASASQMRNDLVKYIECAPVSDDPEATRVLGNAYLNYKPVSAPSTSEAQKPKTSYVDDSVRAAREYSEAFSDRIEPTQDDKLKKKKTTLAAVCVILAAVVIGGVCIILFGGDDVKNTTAHTTLPAAPTKVYQASDYYYTTQPTLPTTQATTESTTERTTESTTERTTKHTTQSTTERSTTSVPTTRREHTTRTTTTEPTTQPTTQERTTRRSLFGGNNNYSITLYKRSSHSDGDKADSRRVYRDIYADGEKTVTNGEIRSVVVNMDDIGENPRKAGNAYICQVNNGTVTLKQPINFSCVRTEDPYNSVISITADINAEIYEEDGSAVYVVFEEGAIKTDTSVNLPFQIKL